MSTYYTLYGLRSLGVDAELIQFPIGPGDVLRGDDVPIHYASSPIDRRLQFSPRYERDVLSLGAYDLYHAQGVWQWPTYALASAARRCGRPYVITPRGMLYPQDIAKRSTLFKKLSLRLRLLSDLNRASCVHVTCAEEMHHCRSLKVHSPIAVIPNPVEIRAYPARKPDGIFRLGYLGRLSPRKNVESLIRAFASLGDASGSSELLIIGGGDSEYERFLRSEASRLRVSNVRFAGFLSGPSKDDALSSCSVLAMPSEFENLGNVILEGLVRGIPCIATKGSPWSELETHACGWWVEYSQSAITRAVHEAFHTSPSELERKGIRGRRLMEERYSVSSVARDFLLLYRWILGEVAQPSFVHTLPPFTGGGIFLLLLLTVSGRRSAGGRSAA